MCRSGVVLLISEAEVEFNPGRQVHGPQTEAGAPGPLSFWNDASRNLSTRACMQETPQETLAEKKLRLLHFFKWMRASFTG